MESWDALWAEVDRLLAGGRPDVDALARHVAGAQADGVVDRELRTARTARWLAGLAETCGRVCTEPDADREAEIATMRMIATRWLRPARMGPLPDREPAGVR